MAQKLYRSDEDRVISGLCGGIGEYFDIDSTVVRIIFVILAIWGGVGIVLYIIGILLIPQRPNRLSDGGSKDEKRPVEDIGEKVSAVASEIRENLRQSNRKTGMRGDFILGLVIIIFGILLLMENIFPKFGFNLFWPIVLILIGVLIPEAKFVGIEIIQNRVLFAENRKQALGLKNASFTRMDIKDADISEGDVFFLFNPFSDRTLNVVGHRLKRIAKDKPIIIICWGGPSINEFFKRQNWISQFYPPEEMRIEKLCYFKSL